MIILSGCAAITNPVADGLPVPRGRTATPISARGAAALTSAMSDDAVEPWPRPYGSIRI